MTTTTATVSMRNGVDTAVNMAEYLQIDHRWIGSTMTGGSVFEFCVQRAAAAIPLRAVKR